MKYDIPLNQKKRNESSLATGAANFSPSDKETEFDHYVTRLMIHKNFSILFGSEQSSFFFNSAEMS